MRKRLPVSLLLRAVTGLMAIVLVASFAIVAGVTYKRMQTAEHVLVTADIARDLFTAMQALRVERGTINTAIETADPIDISTRNDVTLLRAQSDAALDSALMKFTRFPLQGTIPAISGIREDRRNFIAVRQQADAALVKPRDERPISLSAQWIATGGRLVDALDALSEILSNDIVQADPVFAEMMKMKQLAWTVRDAAGFDRLLVGAAIAQGKGFPAETLLQTTALSGRMDAAWAIIEGDTRLPVTPRALRDAVDNARHLYFDVLRAERKEIVEALSAGKPLAISGTGWVALSNPGLESLMNVANVAFNLTDAHAKAEADAAQRYFLIAGSLTLFFIGFGLFATGLVNRRVVRPMATITKAVRSVAAGDLATGIPFEHRSDELGDLARALVVFRDNAFAKQHMEGELVRKERLSALGHLTGTVAHELRNPLSAIRNAAYLLREMAGGGGVLEGPVARIERSVARCDRIISDLLDFTRIRDLQLASIAADEWIGGVLDDQKLPDGIVLMRQLAAPGRQIDFDGERMRQVVINLVDNAVQALTGQGADAGDRRLIVATRATDAFYEFAIRDTGPGIAGEVLAKVFEPLFTTKASGTGLGLPTVKQIVEQHGGTVTITSEPGIGTVVTVNLPYRATAEIAA